MLWIDWFTLNWFEISAWILGILLGFYIAIRVKNYFFRWSASPPKFLQPFSIHQETMSQKDMKQIKLMVEDGSEKLDPVVIWAVGKCPRFLLNIACSLSLHSKKVYVNEVKSHSISLRQLESDGADVCQIFYGSAVQIRNNFNEQPQNNIIILLAPQVLKHMKGRSGFKKYLILGRRIKQDDVQALEKEGFLIINLEGGKYFRGRELSLLGELIAILKNNRGTQDEKK